MSRCCSRCAGVSRTLPTVTLKDIPDLRWVLAKGEYSAAEGEGSAEGDDGSTAAAALWAVDSLRRRAGPLPAMQLSHIDRQHKTPVGLVRGVKENSADSIMLEVWFIEDVVVEEPDEAGGNQPAQQQPGEPSASEPGRVRNQSPAEQ